MTDAAALPGQPRGGPIAGPATERASCVLAPNPSPMTLDGTNTWIVAEPDAALAVVIDPGPLDEGHLREVVARVERSGRRVGLTLLTHGHPDHAEGAARFAELTGSRVRALDPALRLGEEGLAEGDVVTTGGLELRVVPTPGHTADSLSFHLPADAAVLTGDTVLGRGTTMVAHPDGRLGDYLDSLRRLRALADDSGVRTVLPGHGPVLDDAQGAVDHYLAHRAARLAQVEAALKELVGLPENGPGASDLAVRGAGAGGADDGAGAVGGRGVEPAGGEAPGRLPGSVERGPELAELVVARVYADVDRSLWPAALLSVRAQLDYLRERGAA